MDPSRIRLEDDRFGLIGMSFRPKNRATFLGMRDDDYVWSIGIVVGDEDEIQTVEIDEHGAKSSRMLTPGELFEGLEILASPGSEAYLIVGALTLMGMDLRATNAETAHEFAEVLRAAADDRDWRLPLHLIGQPRDLQLSTQGRDILRRTASELERQGETRTSLSAAQRLELSASALDSIRRRISRKSLQAYRMHGRWYVVLDNLTRSRATEQNGTHKAAAATPTVVETTASPFEEMPEAEVPEAAVEEPFVPLEESAEEVTVAETEPFAQEAEPVEQTAADAWPEAPTADELAAFLAEEPSETLEAAETHEMETGDEAEAVATPEEEPAEASFESEAAAEEQAAREALAREAGFYPEIEVEEEASAEGAAPEEGQQGAGPEAPVSQEREPEIPDEIDQFISETVLEQFIVSEIDAFVRDVEAAEETPEESSEGTSTSEAEAEPEEQVETTAVDETNIEWQEEPGAVTAPLEAETTAEPEPEAGAAEEEIALSADEDAIAAGTPLPEWPEERSVEGEPSEMESATEEATTIQIEGPSETVAAESFVDESIDQAPERAEVPGEEPEAAEEAEALEDEGLAAEHPTAETVEEPEEPDVEEAIEEPEPVAAEDEFDQTAASAAEELAAAEPEVAEEARSTEEPQPRTTEIPPDLLAHLREEVAYLRQQGQEKDRQIVAWINGAQWLQPFVEQIRSLERQVEHLGELQAQRDSDRIADLVAERERLRGRLTQLESDIETARAAADNAKGRSWFRRMMRSE